MAVLPTHRGKLSATRFQRPSQSSARLPTCSAHCNSPPPLTPETTACHTLPCLPPSCPCGYFPKISFLLSSTIPHISPQTFTSPTAGPLHVSFPQSFFLFLMPKEKMDPSFFCALFVSYLWFFHGISNPVYL